MVSRIVGICLVIVSALSIVQTIREIALFEIGRSAYSETLLRNVPIRFAGRLVSVSDDQPNNASHSQQQVDGILRLTIDSTLLAPSYARVRPGIDDLGRYHGWLNAWIFRSFARSDSTLWLARRIQPSESKQPRYEFTIIGSDGNVDSNTVWGWQLATSYLRYRSSQFVRSADWTVMPLSVAAGFGLSPILWLIFPIGTLAFGLILLRRTRGKLRTLTA